MTTAEKLVKVLAEKKMTCATAESYTGGGVGNAISAIPGSSAVFRDGIICYDNATKKQFLDNEEMLSTYGSVSSECAAALAKGVHDRLGIQGVRPRGGLHFRRDLVAFCEDICREA